MITLTYLLILLICVLVSVAFLTLLERKFLRIIGTRLGPNKVGFFGLLQPFSDALKLSNKQPNSLSNFSFFFYYVRCFIVLFSRVSIWISLWLTCNFLTVKLNFLVIIFILSLSRIRLIIRGWSTYGKYTLLGGMRGVSQLISYESSLYLCFFLLLFFYESFNFFGFQFHLFDSFFYVIPFCVYIWLPCYLSELNRTPFDFSEGESELVRGFNTDMGSSGFTLVFLGEYSNILFLSLISSFLFFSLYFFIFFLLFIVFTVWIRSVLPRFRFDKLISLA